LNRLPRSLQQHFETKTGDAYYRAAAQSVVAFNSAAISAAKGRIPAVKPQFAFYEQLGSPGWEALEETCRMAREAGLLIVGDAKRGDISSTAAAYARAILDPNGPLGCDSVTLNPWMGTDVIEPFLPYCQDAGRGIFVLLRTTNPGSGLLQKHHNAASLLASTLSKRSEPMIGDSGWSPIGAVVGAQAFVEAQSLRAKMPAGWFLVPGVGAQGASLSQGLAGQRDGLGSLVSCSRSLLFPSGDDDHFQNDPQSFIANRIGDFIQMMQS